MFVFRGLAHVGIIHAMENAGIPIDIIGGTSIGSLIAGIWAGERNVDRTKIKAKGWAKVSVQRYKVSN